ncbi:hypothetical protein KKJFFJLC_00047 [Vibrio phage vB_VpaS_PGB]|nr:hypothetical protein HHKILHMN_00050 [Vibrio phage vB_VpaS_PGA]WVH05590.1 hypothetical protein KKJFFJLC_00047 [Vibrio phage vB_VpaS_PGB]
METITLNIGSENVAFVFTFNYTPEIKGVYDSMPEHCYPTEPEEFELISLKTEDGDDCDWMLGIVGDEIVEQLKENQLGDNL